MNNNQNVNSQTIGANILKISQDKGISRLELFHAFSDLVLDKYKGALKYEYPNFVACLFGLKYFSWQDLQIIAELLEVPITKFLEENDNLYEAIFGEEMAKKLSEFDKDKISKLLDWINSMILWNTLSNGV